MRRIRGELSGLRLVRRDVAKAELRMRQPRATADPGHPILSTYMGELALKRNPVRDPMRGVDLMVLGYVGASTASHVAPGNRGFSSQAAPGNQLPD